MKTPLQPLILGCLALAAGTLLTSCVDPYAHNYGPQEGPRPYRSGYVVRDLPPGYRTETISGTRYYYHNGTYYRPRSGGYVVVEAPRHGYGSPPVYREQVIPRLPRGYREVYYRGNRYYQANDVYYQQRGSGYIIVTRPY